MNITRAETNPEKDFALFADLPQFSTLSPIGTGVVSIVKKLFHLQVMDLAARWASLLNGIRIMTTF